MLIPRLISIRFADFFQCCFEANSEDFIRVKLLQMLDTHDFDKVKVHQPPQQQHHGNSCIESVSPHASAHFFDFLRDKILERPRFRVLCPGVDLHGPVDYRLDRVVSERDGDTCHQCHREVVECRVIILEHVFLSVAFKVVAE